MLTSRRSATAGTMTDMRIYLDAAPVIYLVEKIPPWADLVRARVEQPDVVLVARDLTRMECRVKPLRNGNRTLLHDFDEYLSNAVTEHTLLSTEVMDRAAEIRAAFRFKTPDAIHLAAATVSGCDVFLTNDHRLDSYTGIAVEVIRP
jgi:uncharacterized protein